MKKIYTLGLAIFLLISASQLFAQRIFSGTLRDGTLADPYKMPSAYDEKWEDFHYTGDNYASDPTNDYMNFLLLRPENFQDDGVTKYPMVVFLHGAGESGRSWTGRYAYPTSDPRFDNNTKQLTHGGQDHEDAVYKFDPGHYYHFPGFMFYPQVHHNGAWSSETNTRYTIACIEELLENFPIDPKRIYIHGLSNGGKGTWNYIAERPDLFAAALPMSAAGGTDLTMLDKIKHIPIWISQGGLDKNPTPSASEGTINALANLGVITENIAPATNKQILPNPDPNKYKNRYTLYPNIGHGVWNSTYDRYDFFAWMLQYSKLSIRVFEGITQFCPGEVISVKLGITAGFDEYEWSKNETTLPSSNTNEITVTELGNYRVRFRKGAEWTEWSEAVELKEFDSSFSPLLFTNFSTTLPALDGSSSVQLSASSGYPLYRWFKNGSFISESSDNIINVSEAGAYSVQVQLPGGCFSSSSLAQVVTLDALNQALPTPTLFTATEVSETEVNLSWEDNSTNEKGFEIYRSEQPGGPYSFVTKLPANTVSFSNTALLPGTVYFYRMRAFNDLGGSNYTGEVKSNTSSDIVPPSIPQNIKAIEVSNNSLKLIWDESTDNIAVAKYEVYQGDIALGTTSDNEFVINGLTEATIYTFRVRSIDIKGNKSDFSSQFAVSTLTFVGSGINYSFYQGTWNNLPDFTSLSPTVTGTVANFNINVRPSGIDDKFGFVFEGFIIIDVAGEYTFYCASDDGSKLFIGENELIDNDGLHGTIEVNGSIELEIGVYPIRVLFFENGGGQALTVSYQGPGISKQQIPNSKLTRLGNPTALNPPALPTDLEANFNADKFAITLDWQDNSNNESGFEIYRSLFESTNFEIIYTTDANASQFIDDKLLTDTIYYYKIKSISDNGSSDLSNIASAATFGVINIPNGNPDNLIMVGSYADGIEIRWEDNSTNETGFIIERAISEPTNFVEVKSVSSPSFRDLDVLNNQKYYYRVKAYNFAGSSDYSNTLEVFSAPASKTKINFTIYSVADNSWNNISQGDRDVLAGEFHLLTDEFQSSTPHKLTFLTNFDINYSANTSGSNAGVFPDIVLQRGYQIADGKVGRFKISGFNINKTYKLSLLGNDKLGQTYTEFTIDGQTIVQWGKNNYYNLAEFLSVTPDNVGNIIVEMKPSSGSTAHLNGFTFEENLVGLNNANPPTDLQASLDGIQFAIFLNWTDDNFNDIQTKIYRSLSADGVYELIDSVGANITNYRDISIDPNVIYYYKLKAENVSGLSVYSNMVSILAPGTPGAPNAPTSLSALSVSFAGIELGWIDNSETETGFNVQRSSSASGPFSEIGTAGENETTFMDIQIESNKTYYYRVYAVNLGGASAYSNVIEVVSAQAPDVKVNFTIYTLGDASWNNVTIGDKNPIAGNVYPLKDEDGFDLPVNLTLLTDFSINYSSNTTGSNSGIYPDNILFRGYQLSSGVSGSFKISGLNPDKLYDFEMLGNDKGAATTIYTIGSEVVSLYTKNNYTDLAQFKGIAPNAQGEVVIELEGESGSIGYINSLVFRESSFTAGRQSLLSDNELILNSEQREISTLLQNYPNPVRDYTIIPFTLTKDDWVTISFFNINGELIYSITQNFVKGYNEYLFETPQLKNNTGVIIYQIEAPDITLRNKFIKIK